MFLKSIILRNINKILHIENDFNFNIEKLKLLKSERIELVYEK